ncbi:MAG: hypothetical protein GY715_08115 [Planctomycetes bacterium]|nr:hypothetical protein [Planctomycetota bacterium]
MTRTIAAVISFVVLCGVDATQAANCTITAILSPDSFPIESLGTLRTVQRVAVTNSGDWVASISVNNDAGPAVTALLANGEVLVRTGHAPDEPAGTTVKSILGMDTNNQGDVLWAVGLDGLPGGTNYGYYANGQLLAWKHGPAEAEELAPGSTYGAIYGGSIDDAGRVVLTAYVYETPSTGLFVVLLLVPDAGGTYTEHVILREEDPLHAPAWYFIDGGGVAADNDGAVLARLNVLAPSGYELSGYYRIGYDDPANLTIEQLASVLGPLAVPNEHWAILGGADIGAGTHVIRGESQIGSHGDSDVVITRDDSVFLQEGDHIGGGHATLTKTNAVRTNDHGEILWHGQWAGEPWEELPFALFMNRRPLAIPGVTEVDGLTLEYVTDGVSAISDSGAFVVFSAGVVAGEPTHQGLYMVQREPNTCFTENLDCDARVGFSDLLTVISRWGPCPGICFEDLDRDGSIGFAELLLLIYAWGPCLPD